MDTTSLVDKEALAKEFKELEQVKSREAKSRAVVLEILGDIPDADVTPPKNVLFVCKLNPVTNAEDLGIIFSRFGEIKSCDIIKDYKTGDSLQYGFIEFKTEDACNEAYFKMQNVLIDDRRIHVDFCQSVAGHWKRFKDGRGATRVRTQRHYKPQDRRQQLLHTSSNRPSRSRSKDGIHHNHRHRDYKDKRSRDHHSKSRHRSERDHRRDYGYDRDRKRERRR